MAKGEFQSFVLLSACALLLSGCPQEGGNYRQLGEGDDVVNTAPHDHHHEHGPHGGHIIELGDYHGEVTVDGSRVVTLFLLGEDAKTAALVSAATATLHLHAGDEEKEIPLVAAPLEGEEDGQTSRFTAAADALPESVKDIEELEGSISLKVGDKEYRAELSHDHDHDHDHKH